MLENNGYLRIRHIDKVFRSREKKLACVRIELTTSLSQQDVHEMDATAPHGPDQPIETPFYQCSRSMFNLIPAPNADYCHDVMISIRVYDIYCNPKYKRIQS